MAETGQLVALVDNLEPPITHGYSPKRWKVSDPRKVRDPDYYTSGGAFTVTLTWRLSAALEVAPLR